MFVASDALSHYILMMYELSQREKYATEIENARASNSKNSNLISKAASLPNIRFEKEVIEKLRKSVCYKSYCKKWLDRLFKKGLIGLDDYTFAVMYK